MSGEPWTIAWTTVVTLSAHRCSPGSESPASAKYSQRGCHSVLALICAPSCIAHSRRRWFHSCVNSHGVDPSCQKDRGTTSNQQAQFASRVWIDDGEYHHCRSSGGHSC